MTVVSNGGLWNSGTYYPFVCDISAVTQAQNAVVTTTVNHGFVVGNLVSFNIPKEYGMRQLNAVTGVVLSVTSNTVTTDINTLNFDAFTVPSVPSYQVLDPAQILPAGDTNTGYTTTNVLNPALQIPGTFRNTYP